MCFFLLLFSQTFLLVFKAEENTTILFFPVACVSHRRDYKPFQSCWIRNIKSYLTSWQNRVAWCPLSMVCGQALEVSASENCYDLQVGDTTIVMHSNIKIKTAKILQKQHICVWMKRRGQIRAVLDYYGYMKYIMCLCEAFLLFLEECYSIETSLLLGYVFRVFWEESDIKNLNFNLHFPEVSEESHSSTI